jgi:hypothetical protein
LAGSVATAASLVVVLASSVAAVAGVVSPLTGLPAVVLVCAKAMRQATMPTNVSVASFAFILFCLFRRSDVEPLC